MPPAPGHRVPGSTRYCEKGSGGSLNIFAILVLFVIEGRQARAEKQSFSPWRPQKCDLYTVLVVLTLAGCPPLYRTFFACIAHWPHSFLGRDVDQALARPSTFTCWTGPCNVRLGRSQCIRGRAALRATGRLGGKLRDFLLGGEGGAREAGCQLPGMHGAMTVSGATGPREEGPSCESAGLCRGCEEAAGVHEQMGVWAPLEH